MANCKQCGCSLGARPSAVTTGICGYCRERLGWALCGGCSNYTLAPTGEKCPVCYPRDATPKPKVPYSVKCLDPGSAGTLRLNETYVVAEETENTDGDPTYRLDGFPGKMFRRERFVVVPTPPPTVDTANWRTWQQHGLQPGECVCRIPKQQCDYHRNT